MRNGGRLLPHLVFAASALALAQAGALAQQIGTAGAVNPAAQSAPPGAALRTMNVGGNVLFKERINTSDSGSVQLVFVDRTTMNIGPNSQLTIDEFVYDPKANTGRMTATLTKGVMRFVGGQASHTGGATIKTPATTLGVRGGVVTVRHDQQTGTRAINHFGVMTAQTQQGTEVIRRPGFALNVANVSTAPTAPTRAPQAEIDTNNRRLTSSSQQTGGRREAPTDEGASKTVGEVNKQVSTNSVEGQQQTTAQAAQSTTDPALDMASSVQMVQQVSTEAGQTATTAQLTQPKVVVVAPRRFFTMIGSGAGQGDILPVGFVAGQYRETDILGYGVGGLNPDGTANYSSRVMAAGIAINGQGSGQSSTLFGMWGTIFDPGSGEVVFSGGARGTTRLGATSNMGRLSASIASTVNGVTLDADFTPVSATVNQNDIDSAGVRTAQTGFYYLGNNTPSVNYTFSGTAVRTTTQTGLGDVRPTTEIKGSAAGLMRTDSLTTGQYNGPSFPVWGGAYINLTDSSRFGANFFTVRAQGSASGADNFNYANFLFGYQGAGTGSRSAYVDYDYFLAAEAGYNTSPFTRLSTVNGGSLSNHHALMVNTTTAPMNDFFPGVSFCNCEWTRWGFWSSESRRTGVNSSGAPDPVRDRLHMGTWVAGVYSLASDIPVVGQASYAGHIIGSFKTGSAEYIAAGNFQNTVNFGANTSAIAISNLDGRNYAGTVPLAPFNSNDRTWFAGTIPATTGAAANMQITGDFYKNSTSPIGEMGGAFTTTGTGYVGAGTFAARKQ